MCRSWPGCEGTVCAGGGCTWTTSGLRALLSGPRLGYSGEGAVWRGRACRRGQGPHCAGPQRSLWAGWRVFSEQTLKVRAALVATWVCPAQECQLRGPLHSPSSGFQGKICVRPRGVPFPNSYPGVLRGDAVLSIRCRVENGGWGRGREGMVAARGDHWDREK